MNGESPVNEPRFASRELKTYLNPPIRHFLPVSGGRDRYGNRIFSSRNLPGLLGRLRRPGYLDSEGHKTRAALLVSVEGERLIRENPGILNGIDEGLTKLQSGVEVVELGENQTLKSFSRGAQSFVSLLEIGNRKWVIKTRRKKSDNVSQPFINEMLQIQALQKDLGPELAKINVELPTYLFASGQMLCRSFAEGTHPSVNDADFTEKWGMLNDLIRDYVEKRLIERDHLWSGIILDFLTVDGFRKTNNFIKKPDGILACIDMVYFLGTDKSPNRY